MENGLRAALKPKGALGQLLFDRFWASVLRLILVARLEEAGLAPRGSTSRTSISVPSLIERVVPTLVFPTGAEKLEHDQEERNFDPDVFPRLALFARYDRSAAREMYRTMSLLLIMRSDGEAGLKRWVRAAAGARSENDEEKKNA